MTIINHDRKRSADANYENLRCHTQCIIVLVFSIYGQCIPAHCYSLCNDIFDISEEVQFSEEEAMIKLNNDTGCTGDNACVCKVKQQMIKEMQKLTDNQGLLSLLWSKQGECEITGLKSYRSTLFSKHFFSSFFFSTAAEVSTQYLCLKGN